MHFASNDVVDPGRGYCTSFNRMHPTQRLEPVMVLISIRVRYRIAVFGVSATHFAFKSAF